MSNKNNEINKWKIKDVITTVLLSILLIAIQLIINMICMANHFVSMVLSIGFTMLLCGPVSPSVLHICRYNMRMHSMERRFFEEGKTSYSFVDRSQPHV